MTARTNLRIALGGTFNLLVAGQHLARQLPAHGIDVLVHAVPSMQILPQMGTDASDLTRFQPDIVAVFLHCEDLLPTEWSAVDLAAITQYATSKLALVKDQIVRFIEASGATVIVNTVPLAEVHWRSVLSWKHRAVLGRVWRSINGAILDLVDASPQLQVLDVEMLATATPTGACDERLRFAVDGAWRPKLEQAVAEELVRFAVTFAGRSKRVVAVDFDGTLWGGAVGEVGVEGLELGGPFYPGNSFASFQRGLKRLKDQGILLLGASKNDWATARTVLDTYADAGLRPDDFAAFAVGWDPKALMVPEALRDLGLADDSCVFVDDTAAERREVSDAAPQIQTVDPSPPEHALSRLLGAAVFEVLDLTEADLRRTDSYRGRRARNVAQARSASREEFLHGMGMSVRIGRLSAQTLPRFRQLHRRTNQVNTGGEPEVGRSVTAAGHRVALSLSAADRFGDEGMVGGLVVTAGACSVNLDVFFMSCRVMGRGIEMGVLAWLIDEAAHLSPVLHVKFVDTPRNGPVRRLLEECGAAADECPQCGHVLTIATDSPIEAPPWLSVTGDRLAPLIRERSAGS